MTTATQTAPTKAQMHLYSDRMDAGRLKVRTTRCIIPDELRSQYCECGRCAGNGYFPYLHINDGKCFVCHGAGFVLIAESKAKPITHAVVLSGGTDFSYYQPHEYVTVKGSRPSDWSGKNDYFHVVIKKGARVLRRPFPQGGFTTAHFAKAAREGWDVYVLRAHWDGTNHVVDLVDILVATREEAEAGNNLIADLWDTDSTSDYTDHINALFSHVKPALESYLAGE